MKGKLNCARRCDDDVVEEKGEVLCADYCKSREASWDLVSI